jgi:response regulator of citrate/malate metabolism
MSERDDKLTRIEENLAKVLDLLLKATQDKPQTEDLPAGLKDKSPRMQRNVMGYRDELIKLNKEGLHLQAISRGIGLNRCTVRKYMRYLGIKPTKAQAKNILGARKYPKVPSVQEQNEYLKQNPWKTSEEAEL